MTRFHKPDVPRPTGRRRIPLDVVLWGLFEFAVFLTALAAILFSLVLTRPARGATPTPPPLAIQANVYSPDDWQPAIPWVDLARQFRQWGSTDQAWASPIAPELWNANGYPVGPTFVGFCQYKGAGGTFTYSFDGDGDLTFIAGTTIQRMTGPRSGTVQVVARSTDLRFRVTGATAANPFRNLQIRDASYPADALFTRPFLEQFRAVSVLRFLDWSRANSVLAHDWAHRVTPGELQTLPTRGVAWEHQIDLCNATGCAYWIVLPHWITDDYARELAKLINARLAAGLPVYLEYSNEVWNGIFPQFQATLAAAGADPSIRIPADGDASNPYALQYRYQAKRTVDLAKIFRDALGAGRVRPLLNGQAVIRWRVENGLRYLKAAGRLSELWGIGYADYHTATNDAELAPGVTAESLLASMLEDITRDRRDDATLSDEERNRGGLGWIRNYRALAQQYGPGLHVVTYEGGPAFSDTLYVNGAPRTANVDLHRALQSDRRLGDLVAIAGRQFQTEGGDLYGFYASMGEYDGRFGYWPWFDQYGAASPKLDALATLAGLTSPAPPPATPPATQPATQPATKPTTAPATRPTTVPTTLPSVITTVTIDTPIGTITYTPAASAKVSVK